MNGNWTGGMPPNAMTGWGLPRPQYDWTASYSFMPPFLSQMPQNLHLPVPDQGLLPGAPFPDPGQPQFVPPRPPSVSTAPSFSLEPPVLTSTPIHPGPLSVASFPSGPPSVASFPKGGNALPRAWLQPKPEMVDELCGDSLAVEEPELERPKLGLSPGVEQDEETPDSQARPPHVCRLCAGLVGDEFAKRLVLMLVPVPPTFSVSLDEREHAKVHASQAQKSLAEVFPLCFPNAPAPEEREAGSGEQEPIQDPTLSNDSRSAKTGDTSLPPPTAHPPAIPSTSAQPAATASSPTTAPPTFKTPNRAKVGKGAKSQVKKTKLTEFSNGSSVTAATSRTQSEPSEDRAKVPTTPTTPFLERENVSGAHICPHCGASYSASAFLDKHIHLCRQRPKEFRCPKCSSSFGAKHNLKAHVDTVHCPPKHQCPICGKLFNKKDNCTQHKRSQHSNSNPLKCSLCDYSSIRKGDLTKHMSTHSSQKPFACPLCSASFAQNEHLKPHLNKAHSPGQSPLLCPHCGWAFAIKANLSVHINSLHKES